MHLIFRVRLLPSGVVVQVQPNERLLDALDEQVEPGPLGTGLPTACRAANCGACQVIVRQGKGLLIPALPYETERLAELGVPIEGRLGCQVVCAGADSSPDDLPEIVLEVIPRSPTQT